MPDDVQTTLSPDMQPAFDDTDLSLPERPSNLLEPWQGVIEVIPADENTQIRPLGENRILMTDQQADADILWTANAHELLLTIAAQPLEGRLESAGNDFIVVESNERRAARAVRDRLTAHNLPETSISEIIASIEKELLDAEDLPGRAMTEIARYRMRNDGSALTRLTGDTNWPLLITPPHQD